MSPHQAGHALLLAISLHTGAACAVSPLQSISLERDCNGCPTGSRLVLRADGSAEVAKVGKARLGTADESRAGRLSIERFAALVRLAQERGFFALADDLSDPEQQDGPWLLVRLDGTDGHFKQVFHRGVAMPAALAEMVQALDTATGDITFDTLPPR